MAGFDQTSEKTMFAFVSEAGGCCMLCVEAKLVEEERLKCVEGTNPLSIEQMCALLNQFRKILKK